MYNSEIRTIAGKKKINIWWVDDCFTRQTPRVTGGGLLFLNIDEWTDDDFIEQESINPQVYLYLKLLAKEQEVSFHCVSFEYADAFWRMLDKQSSLVLLDIGYSGNSGTYGIDLWLRHTEGHKSAAKIRFLTGDPGRIHSYCREQNREPETPPALQKEDGINLQDVNAARIATLLRELVDEQPTALGELSCAEWKGLRDNMKRAVLDFATEINKGTDIGWPHHLPTGGDTKNFLHKESGILKLQKACLHPITRSQLYLPDFVWD